jgi:hypothetical protein
MDGTSVGTLPLGQVLAGQDRGTLISTHLIAICTATISIGMMRPKIVPRKKYCSPLMCFPLNIKPKNNDHTSTNTNKHTQKL